MKNDSVDKLVIFLAKRDGIDKLVKTFQYVSKLVHWQADKNQLPDLANRFKQWEVASGLSRKAFRTGRFLTGFNALRRSPGSSPVLAVLANAGEMVYFFFDHFLWLSRIGTLDPTLARKMSFISAFGESFGYVFFIIADFIMLKREFQQERDLLLLMKKKKKKLMQLQSQSQRDDDDDDKELVVDNTANTREEEEEEEMRRIRGERIMRVMGVAANLADLVIALADIEPNPLCNHTLTLGISGLVSAWAGWYRNWPST